MVSLGTLYRDSARRLVIRTSRTTRALLACESGDATWMMASTPFTAGERSEVARSSITVVVNLSPNEA